MSLSFKKIPALLLLLSFLTLVLFGFAMMVHEEDGSMSVDCPLSTFGGGTSLCPQDTLAIVMHHVSAYNTFLSIPIPAGFSVLLTTLLALAYVVFSLYISPQILVPIVLRTQPYTSPPSASPLGRKIARWLSLLEHSPSAG